MPTKQTDRRIMKPSQKNKLYTVAIFLLYTLIVWKLAIVMHYDKTEDTMSYGVEQRLEEANENWLRGLSARRNLEATRPLDPKDQWNFNSGVIFWDFFYPTFDCPYTVERIGNSGDGGKWVCGFKQLTKKPDPCIVYSYGVSQEISFEEEVLNRTNCSVFMFDHTIDVTKVKLPSKYPGRVFLEKIGLGVEDGGNIRSLKSQMKRNQHTFVDILKMDIEGAEHDVFNGFKDQFPDGLPFGQLQVEIHLNKTPDPGFYKQYKYWMTNLDNMGLRAFRNELNLLGSGQGGLSPPTLSEYSFLNVKVDHWLLH